LGLPVTKNDAMRNRARVISLRALAAVGDVRVVDEADDFVVVVVVEGPGP